METPPASPFSLPQVLARARVFFGHWVWADVLAPMILVRLCLLMVGWLSQLLVPNPKYPAPSVLERGWHFSQSRLLDMWARWDAAWYFGIIRAGYDMHDPNAPNNFAFFPLYPYLIRLLIWPLPERMRTTERLLIIGLLVSNAFLVGALILLHKLVASWGDRELARRTILYTLLFPTGFILCCFYTESTFLFFSVAAFYAAARRAWGLASLAGMLLALTRPQGVLIAVPLVWLYLASVGWKLKRVRLDVLWFSLIPTGLLAYFYYAYTKTGDLLMPIHAQQAWGKKLTMPWLTLFYPYGGIRYVTNVEQVLTIAFIALSIFCLCKLPSAAYGIYSLLLILPPLLSGTLLSTSRYYVVVVPVFIALAMLGRRATFERLLLPVLFSLQVLFMIAWACFYWVA